MEISHYLSIVRRWAWLLILGLVLGIAGGYGIAKLQTPIYQASTRVVVSRTSMQTASGASSNSNGIYDYFLSDQILIQTYVELLKATPIFDNVSQIVGYPVSPSQVTAEQVKDTRIISINVEDPNAQHAADIANAVVQALITQNDELETGRYKTSDDSLQVQIQQVEDQIAKYQTDLENLSTTTVDEQLAQVQKQMAPLQAEVTQLQKDIAILTPAWSSERKAKVTELQSRLDQIQPLLALYQQIYTNLTVSGTSGTGNGSTNTDPNTARLQNTLSLYQQIYLNLINTREAIRLARMQNTQSVNQIEPATVPSKPVRPIPMQISLAGGFIGLMLAGGIIFLIEFLDDTLKLPEDAERILELPMIGYIADMQVNTNNNAEDTGGIYVARQPRSPVAEAFRSLRTNIEFASVDKPLRTVLVTSAEASDGKSTVSTNLAAIFAQGGKRVMLIDCDLRRPRIHRFAGFQNRIGMTDLFRGSHTLDEVMHTWTAAGAPDILVVTSGSLPPNPAELLGSQKMNHILEEMASRVDIVVIDSPPSMVADAQVLAAKVDCVVLVAQPGKTHAGAARATREQLDRAGAHIIGIVFNRIPRERGYYYGGYRYYSPYYYQNDKYLTDNSQTSPFEQHSLETNKTVFQSFLKRFSRGNRWQKEETEQPSMEETPAAPLLKNVLDPAGWKSKETNEPEKLEGQDTRARQPQKVTESQSTQETHPPSRSESDLSSEIKKTASLPTDVVKKKAPAQQLLRQAAKKTSLAAAQKAKPRSKLNMPTILRSSSISTPESMVRLNTKLNHSTDFLVGSDYTFLIHKPSAGEDLELYAEKYKTDIKSIAAVNYRIPSPAWIIPVGFTDVAKLPSFLAYEVKEKGATIEALARELKVNLRDLKYYNGIKDTELALTHNWLLIPQAALPAAERALMPEDAKSQKHRLDTPIGTDLKFVIHKVSEDDNLHHYASTYKTSMEAILTITSMPPLWAGTIAVIPIGMTDVSNLPRFEVYEVRETDTTVEALAQELKIDARKLSYYNDIRVDEKLQPGDWLLVARTKSSSLWRSGSYKANLFHA